MTLAEFGAVGELIGGVAVIFSLVYVGVQIKQTADASRVATAQAFAKQYSDLNQMIADPSIGDIFARGLQDLRALPPGEQASFTSVLSSISRTLESFYFQQLSGGLDARLFEGWFTQYLDLHAYPGVAEYWGMRRHQYSDEFAAYLDERLSGRTGKPLYAVS